MKMLGAQPLSALLVTNCSAVSHRPGLVHIRPWDTQISKEMLTAVEEHLWALEIPQSELQVHMSNTLSRKPSVPYIMNLAWNTAWLT